MSEPPAGQAGQMGAVRLIWRRRGVKHPRAAPSVAGARKVALATQPVEGAQVMHPPDRLGETIGAQ
jgi:hypothetical protein